MPQNYRGQRKGKTRDASSEGVWAKLNTDVPSKSRTRMKTLQVVRSNCSLFPKATAEQLDPPCWETTYREMLASVYMPRLNSSTCCVDFFCSFFRFRVVYRFVVAEVQNADLPQRLLKPTGPPSFPLLLRKA
jgi:hypothetical protein